MGENPTGPTSPSQVLIDCLEDFNQDEPTEIVVIYKTQKGDLVFSSNHLQNSNLVGLLEMAKFWFFMECKAKTKE